VLELSRDRSISAALADEAASSSRPHNNHRIYRAPQNLAKLFSKVAMTGQIRTTLKGAPPWRPFEAPRHVTQCIDAVVGYINRVVGPCSEFRTTLDGIVAENDLVVCRLSHTVVHRGGDWT
jgi:hypothetical protein